MRFDHVRVEPRCFRPVFCIVCSARFHSGIVGLRSVRPTHDREGIRSQQQRAEAHIGNEWHFRVSAEAQNLF